MSCDTDDDPLALVQAARSQAETDPAQWAVIEALARRTAAMDGPARPWLMQRLRQRLAARAETTRPSNMRPEPPATPGTGLAGLAALVDSLGRPAATDDPPAGADGPAIRRSLAAAPPPLRSLTALRSTWSRLRIEQRLRQALEQVPAQAGPLNSPHVVHRALQALQRLSPAYLEAFIAQLDTLLALEDAADMPVQPARAPPAKRRNRR